MVNRAVQFMPFASLKGYYDMIEKKNKIKSERKILSEDDCEKISCLLKQINKGMTVSLWYYSGGYYIKREGIVTEIDILFRYIVIVKTKINFDDICEISGENLVFEER